MNLLNQIAGASQEPADQVGVPTKILGAGMHHQINAEVRGPLINGRSERAVNHCHEIVLFCQRRHLMQIHDP